MAQKKPIRIRTNASWGHFSYFRRLYMIQALFAKSYLKTYQGIFYAFMLPTFLLLIFHFIKIVPPGGYGDGAIVVVSSFVLLPALTIGVTSVPNVITE